MPAYILPIERTRAAFLKPPGGLRFGNFEGVVNLPPLKPLVSSLGAQSFSSLNNNQIYKAVCDWYETWRPWQQRVLICGIVDRCSMRQVDMLATTLEPVKHRDYTVAVNHQYPTTPLKKIRDNKKKKKKAPAKKKKNKQKSVKEPSTFQLTLTREGTFANASSPVSVIDDDQENLLRSQGDVIYEKLESQTITYDGNHTQRTLDQSESRLQSTNIEDFANSLASRILLESIPKTVKIFDPSELYAQDLASTIVQQAMDSVELFMTAKEKSILERTTKLYTLIDEQEHGMREQVSYENMLATDPLHNSPVAQVVSGKIRLDGPGISPVKRVIVRSESEKPEKKVDMSILDKYRKYKQPSDSDKPDFYKMTGRPKSLVRILVPEKGAPGELKRSDSPKSMVSRWSAVTHSTLSELRYKLFGARAVATPDFFKSDGVGQTQGGMLHLRQGGVRRPQGIQSVPVPISKLYKSVKWWTEGAGDGKSLVRAQKSELGASFKEQLQQVWKWMSLWEDFEKVALLKVLLKLCTPEDLNFLYAHLHQRLRDHRDINRLSDKLLLYIFSFTPASGITTLKKVCRRWRYLCATDDLWMIKCHELGLQEGIKNLEKMIVHAKGYRMVIDWRMAYDEIRLITDKMKQAMMKKKEKPPPQGRTVEFKEQLEELKQKVDNISVTSSESSSFEPDYPRPKFEFTNKIVLTNVAPRAALTREELQAIIKRLVIDPEEKEKERAISRGTPVIVELEVKRGTLSAVRGQPRQVDVDGQSVVSEDLRHYDDEYRIQWDTMPDRKRTNPSSVMLTEATVELIGATPDIKQGPKDPFSALRKDVGPSILRRKPQNMADDAAGDDVAYDIRPDLVPATDIMGKAKANMSLKWHQEPQGSPSGQDHTPRYTRPPRFVGEVRSVLRARKLQGHMSGITCVQFDKRRLVSAGLDRVIRMWDIRSGRSLHKFLGHKGGVRCLQFYGNELATGSWDTTIMIWDLRNLCRHHILTDHSDSVTCLALNQDFMVSGSEDTTVRVWRRATYFCSNVIRGHKMGVTSIAFDGSHVVSASKDGNLRLSNILSGECVWTFLAADVPVPIYTVAMKGSLILSGDSMGRVYFWNKMTGENEAAIEAHTGAINKLAYLAGRFYTASGDGSIREWDLVTMTSVRLLEGHKGPVRDFMVTSERMVSCSEDGSIRIWDLFDPRKKTTEAEQIQQLYQDSL
ncbi:uncharacterized protein LOC127875293 isoform X2 [Dreissena polymorpha]|uniref:uncharacterized protein LOC127875293 isoform X2 n=1 Tax=Dreissena polymorpha TaxID=45954 RepID=UPI002264A1EC|nr:uncharacterized protein LOC127875293 isoform X2 [Dreissena polymorpha]